MSSDQLRWVWTVVGAVGVLAFFVGLTVLVFLSRDAVRYDWALGQLQRPGLDLARMQSHGDVRDMWMLVAVMLALGAGVTAAFVAGVAASFAQTQFAIVLLVADEVFSVLGTIVLVILGLLKLRQRNAIRNAVQLAKKEHT